MYFERKQDGYNLKKMVISKENMLNFKEKTIRVYNVNNDYKIFYKKYD